MRKYEKGSVRKCEKGQRKCEKGQRRLEKVRRSVRKSGPGASRSSYLFNTV